MYYLFTHNDLDGVGCGIVARCAFGDDVEIRYNSVSSLNGQVQRFLDKQEQKGKKKHDFGFVTDLSVNEDTEAGIDRFIKQRGKFQLIDHHKTSLHLNRHPWARVTLQYEDGRLTSATSLFYDYLIDTGLLRPKPAIAEFVELVRLYDTWEWEAAGSDQAKRLNELFFMVSIDEFEAKMAERLKHHASFFFDDFEQKILDMEQEKIERYLRRKKRELLQTFIGEHCVGIVHAESYHSELGNELGKENPHLDYIVILNMGARRMSFRTIHDQMDVSEIAGLYGGGGHAKAAGCSLGETPYRLYVAETFATEPIQPDAARNLYNVKGAENGTLYENRSDDSFWIASDGHRWSVERNGVPLDRAFASFDEAERHVKRNYAAWLARDEAYVKLLRELATDSKMGDASLAPVGKP
jgi:hypothetical protein